MQRTHNCFPCCRRSGLAPLRCRDLLPPTDQPDGIFTAVATDFDVSFERRTHRRAFRLAEDPAQIIDRQLHATFSRSEEHTSELQSLMRISYAVFCLKTKQ